MGQPSICVIFNPASGKGQAGRRLAQLGKQWGAHAQFQPTAHAGHGVDLARAAAQAGFGIVVAAGGDGTVHEVANGLLQSGRRNIGFAIIPLGSANDYHASLEMEPPADTSGSRVVDVGVVRGPGGRQTYFVCCLGLGLNGAVTLAVAQAQAFARHCPLRFGDVACPVVSLWLPGHGGRLRR